MDKTKIIAIVFLVIVLGLTGITLKIIGDKNALTKERDELVKQNKNLNDKNDELQGRYNELERKSQEKDDHIQKMQEELDRLTNQKADLQRQRDDLTRQRDELVEKLKEKPKETQQAQVKAEGVSGGGFTPLSEEYWADFVKAKAALQVQLEELNKQYNDAKIKIVDLEKVNKDLSLKIDEVTKERDRLDRDMRIKEREMNNVSRDLVGEREARRISMEELIKLRGENVGLKRELGLLNKEKAQLQTNIKDIVEKKNALEQKISGVENIMKAKSLELDELQRDLTTTIKGKPEEMTRESASVELPPIVVKPGIGGKGVRGEVLAVNPQEKFVVVNLGENASITPGSLLRVMRGSREIGTIEVVETRKEISAADIKEMTEGFSIQEGDAVVGK
jgi:chromosome segregation ATPase